MFKILIKILVCIFISTPAFSKNSKRKINSNDIPDQTQEWARVYSQFIKKKDDEVVLCGSKAEINQLLADVFKESKFTITHFNTTPPGMTESGGTSSEWELQICLVAKRL